MCCRLSAVAGSRCRGIHNVGTVASARRKGIGAVMTVMAQLEARAPGYRVGILDPSKLGFGVHQRPGFQEQCRMGHYVWVGDWANQDAGQPADKLPPRRM